MIFLFSHVHSTIFFFFLQDLKRGGHYQWTVTRPEVLGHRPKAVVQSHNKNHRADEKDSLMTQEKDRNSTIHNQYSGVLARGQSHRSTGYKMGSRAKSRPTHIKPTDY